MIASNLFVESSDALPLVSVLVAFRSGSAHDPAGREGLSRITARMLRRGSEGMSADRIEETIDALGGELSADVALSASTVHFEVIKRNLWPFVDLASNVIARPTFDRDELARLRREAAAEIVESRDSDRVLASRALRRTIFEGHPYARRVAGTIPSIEAITEADVRACYARHYCRKNALVAIAGDVDDAEAKAIADKILAGLPEGEAVPDTVPEPTLAPGRRLVFVDKPERTQAQMVVGGLGTHAHDADHIPLMVANTAFGGTFTSRLMQEIRVKRGWSYGASSRVSFDRRRDTFSMGAAPAAADAPGCLALMIELLGALRDKGITEDELAFVKRYVVRSHAFDVDTAKKRVHHPLDEALFDLPEGYYRRYLSAVEAVTLADANEAVRRRLPSSDMVIAVVGTHAAFGDAVAKAIPDLASVTVVPFDIE